MHFDEKFFVSVATIIFAAIVFKPARKAILSALDSRIDKIKKELDEAMRLRNEAEAILRTAKAHLSESEKQANDIIAYAEKEASEMLRNAKDKLAKDVENRRVLAVQKIKNFEESAITEMKRNIANIAISATAQVIEEGSDEESFKKLVGNSLDKISKTVH